MTSSPLNHSSDKNLFWGKKYTGGVEGMIVHMRIQKYEIT
jgi:hypothetical protein